jgi:hypothetical protein
MITRSYKRLSLWLTTAALLGAAVPASAQDGETGGPPEPDAVGEVRLNLEKTLTLAMTFQGGDSYPDGLAAAVAPRTGPLPDLSRATAPAWSSLRGSGTTLQQQTQEAEAQAAPKKRGFGRWLKKHWYVPVLVAGAIGVAVDSGGDDDSTGEDD